MDARVSPAHDEGKIGLLVCGGLLTGDVGIGKAGTARIPGHTAAFAINFCTCCDQFKARDSSGREIT
jgi:hypothetical protein